MNDTSKFLDRPLKSAIKETLSDTPVVCLARGNRAKRRWCASLNLNTAILSLDNPETLSLFSSWKVNAKDNINPAY